MTRLVQFIFALAVASPLLGDESLLQEAYYREMTLNDPRGAVPIYDRVIATADSTRSKAIANVRRAVCLHKQGRLEEAEEAFLSVLDRFSSETDAVRVASRYLNVDARRHPARFMSPETLVYVEIVEPGQQVEFLTDLLRGTPLENPVDYYLARSAQAATTSAPSRPTPPRNSDLRGLRAILNLGFLKELQKIEGFAIGITDFAEDRVDFAGVLLPGTSDLTRGVVKAFITVALEKVEASVEGMTVFSMRDRRRAQGDSELFVAMGRNEEVVFFGTSLELVRGAVLRSISRDESRSLADLPDFRRSLSARAGSLFFAYVNPRSIIERTREVIPATRVPSFDALVNLLGLDGLHAASITFSRLGDSFRYALSGRFSGDDPKWAAFRTPVLEPECLDLVPKQALGFLTFSIDEVDSHLRVLESVLRQRGLPWSPPLRIRRVLEKLESVALVQPYFGAPPPDTDSSSWWYVVLAFDRDPVVDRDFDRLVRFVFTTIYRNRASAEFRDALEPIVFHGVDARLHLVEPAPGRVAGFARVPPTPGSRRQLFVVAPRAETLRTLFHRGADEEVGFPRDEVPVATSKFLFLAPKLLSPYIPELRDPRDPLSAIIASLPKIALHTRESSRGLSLEMRILDAAPVLRMLLRGLPTQPTAERQ